MRTPTLLPEDGLRSYGVPLASYRGTGQLTLSPTGRVVRCQFLAGQLEDGKTLLLCATPDPPVELMIGVSTPAHFEGVTNEGLTIQSKRGLVETNYLPQLSDHQARWLALRVGHLEVSQPRLRHRKRLVYLLSNVMGVDSGASFSLDGITLELRPIEGYAGNSRRIQVLRSVLPTAQIEINTTVQVDRVSRAVDEACYLLSLALGTKVQWIALTEETKAHQWIRRHHFSHVTKRYCPLSVLDRSTLEVSSYLCQAADGRFTRAREQVGLRNAVIDTYLDAKSEADFLQVRALKLVVAVEMLKAEYVKQSGAPSFIVAPKIFEASVPKLKEVLKASFGKAERAALYANLPCLNRTSFATHLRSVCAAVRMPVSSEDLDRFVASRNKLVHEGLFYCERATDREKVKIQPLTSVQAEWFWLLHFVDRLFLRALDYEGPYIDWSTPGSPSRSLLCPGAEPPRERFHPIPRALAVG